MGAPRGTRTVPIRGAVSFRTPAFLVPRGGLFSNAPSARRPVGGRCWSPWSDQAWCMRLAASHCRRPRGRRGGGLDLATSSAQGSFSVVRADRVDKARADGCDRALAIEAMLFVLMSQRADGFFSAVSARREVDGIFTASLEDVWTRGYLAPRCCLILLEPTLLELSICSRLYVVVSFFRWCVARRSCSLLPPLQLSFSPSPSACGGAARKQ
jgi:hypothetical protein